MNFDYFNLKTLRISYISSFLQGASSGIGRATAILFSKLGSNLTVVGRDEKALNETVNNCQNSQNVISVVNKWPKKYWNREKMCFNFCIDSQNCRRFDKWKYSEKNYRRDDKKIWQTKHFGKVPTLIKRHFI